MKSVRALVAVAAVIAVGVLGGCAQAGVAGPPTSTRAATSRPTASSTPVATTTGPVSCDALATPAAVTALVGGTGALQPFQHLQAGLALIGPPWNVENANGTVCGWGGLVNLIENQGTPQVFLQVVPGLAAQWSELAATTAPSAGAAYDGATSLASTCSIATSGSCQANLLVGGAWMSVEARGGPNPSLTEQGFHDFVQGVIARYNQLPAPTAVVPHALRDCTDARLLGAVSAAMGPAQADGQREPDFSLGGAMLAAGRVTACPVLSSTNPERGWTAWVEVLDGVSPALFAQYRQAVDHPYGTPVDVSGLPGTAVGVMEETADSTRVTVDVLIGSTWVEVSTYQTDDAKSVVSATAKVIASGWLG